MKASDLRFTILPAALGIIVTLVPITGNAAGASGPYIGAGMGRSDFDTDCAVSGAVTTECEETGTAWKAYVGFQFNNWLGVEGGYTQFGDVDATGLGLTGTFDSKTETWGVPIYAVGSLPIPLDSGGNFKISVLGKIGAIYWDQERTSTLPGNSVSDNGWDLAWGAGVQLTLSEHLGIRGEWEQFNDLGTEDTTGETDVQMWSVSLNYKF
jgi:OOP family OmpA-OmpF porin